VTNGAVASEERTVLSAFHIISCCTLLQQKILPEDPVTQVVVDIWN
jgi:hypothetical protein